MVFALFMVGLTIIFGLLTNFAVPIAILVALPVTLAKFFRNRAKEPTVTPKTYIVSQYILAGFSVLIFMPLLLGFLVELIRKFFTPSPYPYDNETAGIISAVLFISFIVVFAAKVIYQARLLQSVRLALAAPNQEGELPSSVRASFEKYKRRYAAYFLLHIGILTGVIPLLQLLTIWGVCTAGFITLFLYPERKFFFEVKQRISAMQLPIRFHTAPLTVLLILFYVLLPGLGLALYLGLQAVSF